MIFFHFFKINRYLILLLAIFYSQVALSSTLTARWLGVAGVMLTDGKTTLLFDPVFTKPSLKHWFLGSRFSSNQDLVKERLNALKIMKVDAVFASHTHFDHAVDLTEIAKITQATAYGGNSLRKIVFSEAPEVRFIEVANDQVLTIGDFKVHMLERKHGAILRFMDWHFLPGSVPDDFQSGFYQYREGETWSFYVEHPQARILIDQGSTLSAQDERFSGKVDVHFVGVSNKKSLEDLVQKNILRVSARKVLPLHFDFFFLQSDFLEKMILPSANLEQIKEALEKDSSKPDFIVPAINEGIDLVRREISVKR